MAKSKNDNEIYHHVEHPEHITTALPKRINIDGKKISKGLSQLVLALIKLLHELLERQAVRRMECGQLSDEDIERLGMALMQQAEEIEQLRKVFGLRKEDLNLDLGPLGKML